MAQTIRTIILLGMAVLHGAVCGCGKQATTGNQIPAEGLANGTNRRGFAAETGQALAAFNRGSALLEQYEFVKAAAAFEEVVTRMPDWTAARYNLGLAYLNLQETENAENSLEKAKTAFQKVLEENPNHLHAMFCLGMLYQYLGDNTHASEYYARVHQTDPADLHAAYKYAETLLALDEKDEGTSLLETIVAADPGFVSGMYRLATLYQRSGQRDKAKVMFDRFNALKATELTGGIFTVDRPYGSAGKYYLALGADELPITPPVPSSSRILFSPEPRRFGEPITMKACPGGIIRIAGLATGDVDGDGDLDLCITQMGKDGQTRIWLNDGTGNFSAGRILSSQGITPCFGDVDNDGDLDLWIGCSGPDRYFENDGNGQFGLGNESVAGGDLITSTAGLLDIDSDGDLDLLAMRKEKGSIPADGTFEPSAGGVYINNRDGTFTDTAEKLGLVLNGKVISAMAQDDFDNDRDLDMILFFADGDALGWVNDRGWVWHHLARETMGFAPGRVVGATTGDPDKDGDRDLLVFGDTELVLYRNRGGFRFKRDDEFGRRFGRLGGTGGQFADIDNDGDLDIVIGDGIREGNKRGPALLVNHMPGMKYSNVLHTDSGNLLGAIHFPGYAACAAADWTGDGKLDLLLAPTGEAPMLLVNATSGGHWIEIDLMGIREQDKKSRSNNSAIGARVEVKTGTIFQQYAVGGPTGVTTMAPLRIHAGLGPYAKVDWLRILWPDGVLQAELEVPADQVLSLRELQRKTSSCPHLFAWDGRRFAFIADFGGMGGLGYLAEPGVYAGPDSTEYLRIPDLAPLHGHYVVQILEPLEEVVYVDEIQLMAVDHPEGTEVYPHEMMAIGLAPPEFDLFCFREALFPRKAVDHRGMDVTERLRSVDRLYAGATQIDERFTGYAADHFVDLDFGDVLGNLSDRRVVLFLKGWVEYPYSSTSFAAAQAGVHLRAPTLEVWRGGQWVELYRQAGYPAGLNHTMTLNLTGLLKPEDQRIRVSSNMELFWDCIFIAEVQDTKSLTVQTAPVLSGDLHYLGYPREYSPDGRQPNLYDYENMDSAAAWQLMSGHYTRYGDVTRLLDRADDCFVIMGRGEELTLRFDADAFGPVPSGHRRTFILKTDSYCKDMDLYTAHPESVEPLPFHGMSGYPYRADEAYPDDLEHREYRQTYNTRRIDRGK